MKIPRDYFKNVGFIYKCWFHFFSFLEAILPFSIIQKIIKLMPKKSLSTSPSPRISFPEKWVLLNSALSLISIFSIRYSEYITLNKVIIFYASIRIFEIIIYQINVLLFHPYKNMCIKGKNSYKLQNPYRSVVLLWQNLIEIIFWFTSISSFFSDNKNSIIYSIIETTIHIFTFNYDNPTNELSLFQGVIFIEVLCGIILVVISLAKFLGELPHIDLEYKNDEETQQS